MLVFEGYIWEVEECWIELELSVTGEDCKIVVLEGYIDAWGMTLLGIVWTT